MIDFAFNAPIAISAGSHTIHLNNTGSQFHMLLLFRLNEELTVHKIHDLLLDETEELPEGVDEISSWFPVSEGEQAWINLELEPGTYLALCPLHNVNGSGHAHHQFGMRQFIIVNEAE